MNLLEDIERPRRIVQLAVKKAKNQPLKIWLRNDEYGSWEKMAKDMLAKVPALLAEKNLTMTDDKIDGEIAAVIYSTGLQAMYNDALKREKKKRK